ncbi:MAG: tRNA 2-selenouridine synthase [Psychromonas sp.]|jgi:tRNA 2-selenouridine synthase|uniref:tRNA 2-selenouridine(34) synthase MnmH n=1 Tax=Psychromonas sp. TaxID=1884585 RepID=UPI0039E69B6C
MNESIEIQSESASQQDHSQLYRELFLSKTPFIDVRAPVEFAQGAFPGSCNLPLMTDSERAQVGTCYKKSGQEAAVLLGHQLVASDIKNRVSAWAEFKKANPSAWLYCFRGGMRSRLSAQFLKDIGVDINIVPGGYKALRRFLIEQIAQASTQKLTIIGGNTGCGKTLLIKELRNGLDLEGRANHRGSSFGKQVSAQPRQISYENQLAVDIINLSQQSSSLVIEDESKAIGRLYVPLPLYAGMQQASMVVVDDPLAIREQRLCDEYCTLMSEQFTQTLGAELGWKAYQEHLEHGLYGIRKRLGAEKFKALSSVLDAALKQQLSSGSSEGHLNWIAPILRDYYDPMYQYQLSKKADRIKFSGTFDEVKEWLTVNAK